jgi:hypothetical protein
MEDTGEYYGIWKSKPEDCESYDLTKGFSVLQRLRSRNLANMVPIPGLCNVDRCENIKDQYAKLTGHAYAIPVYLGPWKLFPLGAELAIVQHTKDISTVLSIGNNGAMYVSWFDLNADISKVLRLTGKVLYR